MKFVPKVATRFGHRALLKTKGASPTLMVIAGVGGLIGTAVLASRATLDVEPIVAKHRAKRDEIGLVGKDKAQQKRLMHLYTDTAMQMTKLYGPTIAVGVVSTASILYGHKILHGRHVATVAAYTGLMEQFSDYRGRVRKTLGDEVEKGIYEGAHGEWREDPDHKGEYKLHPVFEKNDRSHYLRPWFDEHNVHFSVSPEENYLFLKGVQQHMNNILSIRGHVFLNDVLDALKMPRCSEGAVTGWLYNTDSGDGYIDFGFMTSIDPHSVAFRDFRERTVQLNFNIDGEIYKNI